MPELAPEERFLAFLDLYNFTYIVALCGVLVLLMEYLKLMQWSLRKLLSFLGFSDGEKEEEEGEELEEGV